MELFKNNLEKELFKGLQMCKEKIIIISPFMSLNIAEKLVQIVKDKNIDCKIITRFDRKSFIEKASSLDALKLLIENGVQILVLKDLHSKVYIMDNKRCFVGSANFTNKGLNINHEILLLFDEIAEVEEFNSYANELLTSIKEFGDWLLTIERIQSEKDTIEDYEEGQKQKEKISDSWGADLRSEELVDESPIVLSVPAGDTIHLIGRYCVHAHPISSGYNYTPTEYIAFRKAKGGVMDKIYFIDKKFPLEMKEWRNEIEKIEISDKLKENVINYIVNRYRDFEFDKALKYKFYLLSLLCDLPNEPHPQANNAGGWFYRMKDLKESSGHVYTVRQKEKNYSMSKE
ncbi:phospholipase D-like domain-containing protein [Peribacillus frigoritolerans]|uniref:phospholipase D-like domain-containing protein n=1 Tax=Peribacillus frigoritolerans TaxID=450367 RepID=UPI0037FECEB8